MVDFRSLHESELADWYAHCNDVFQNDDESVFRRKYECDPFKDHSLMFVAFAHGSIVSTVRVLERTVWIAGRAVKAGAICNVGTKPAYRRKGYAGTLLRMAIDAMRKRRMPVSVLFGEEVPFQRMGWRFCPEILKRIDASSLRPLPQAARIRPYQLEELPFLIGIHDLFAGRLDCAVQRSKAYWKQWVLPQWRNPIVLEADGRAIAYCCHSEEEGEKALQINELCATPQGEALLPGFLRAVAEQNNHSRVLLHAALSPIDGETIVKTRLMLRANDAWLADTLQENETSWIQNAGMFSVDMF